MKKILSLLMCYVFLQAETFALRGGPGGVGNAQLSGTYSAVLLQSSPQFDINNIQVTVGPGPGLGLVTLTVPANGPAVGNMLIFDSQTQNTFLGKVNGISNVQTGELIGLVSGTEFKIASSATAGTAQATTSTETIAGRLIASKSKLKRSSSQITGTATLTAAGIPFVTVVQGQVINYIGNGVPATYDLIGYLTGSSDAIAGTFDLTVTN